MFIQGQGSRYKRTSVGPVEESVEAPAVINSVEKSIKALAIHETIGLPQSVELGAYLADCIVAWDRNKREARLAIEKICSAPKAPRFVISPDGVIQDFEQGLEWIVGPDKDTNYNDAVKWVESCRVAGGGWRMPTRKELRGLYQKGKGDRNIDPVFKHTGWWVWAELRDSSSAWVVLFFDGNEYWSNHYDSSDNRVFGVRSHR